MKYTEALAVLNLSGTPSPEDVVAAFRRQALLRHPDTGDSAIPMQRLIEARTTINAYVSVQTEETRSESECTKKLQKKLEEGGAFLFKVHGHAMQKSGWPDLEVYSLIFTGLIEFKSATGSLRGDQREVCRRLAKVGTKVLIGTFVARNRLEVYVWGHEETVIRIPWETETGTGVLTELARLANRPV